MEPESVCGEVLMFDGKIACAPAAPMPVLECKVGGLGTFSLEKTTTLLQAVKKNESKVEGDPLPHPVRRFPEAFAEPVAAIYNGVNEWGRWPASWKIENLMIIPKVPEC